jgi:ABC-type nitrate/sulfonate/bicarbonate transport system substrate-binding protein
VRKLLVKTACRSLSRIIGLSLLLLSAPAAQAQPVKVRVVHPSVDVQYLPAFLAQTRDIFRNEGLEVELIVMLGARSGIQALVSGDVQFVMQLGAAISAIWSGADLKIVAQMTNTVPYSLIVRPEIQKLEDLKGKKIGVSVGSTTQALVHELLRLRTIDSEKRVEYVNIPGAGAKIAALENGLIAAAPLAPPTELKAIRAGFKRLVVFGDALPEMPFTGLVVTTRYLKENPETVERMVRAIVRGTYATQNDMAAAIRAMQRHMKITPEEAKESYLMLRKSFTPNLTEAGIRRMAAMVSNSTGIGPTREPKEYMDLSFLNKALLELGKK